MLPTDLQRSISDVLGYPFATVQMHARRLREAGMLSKGGRGKSAAKMNEEDAVKLMLSLIMSDGPNDSVDAVKRAYEYRYLTRRRISFIKQLSNSKEDIDLVEMMLLLVKGYQSGFFEKYHRSRGGDQEKLGQSLRVAFRLNGERKVIVEYSLLGSSKHELCTIGIAGQDVSPIDRYISNQISGRTLMEIASWFPQKTPGTLE